MAQVLAPIVQTSGTSTMPYSPSDGYQNAPSQPHHQQQRGSQMPRNQAYNGHSSGTGYRGTPTTTPIAPYAFSSTPPLRQENRSVSLPQPQVSQQAPSHVNHARLGHPSHPSSSSDSTVSTSGSSNRSVANPSHVVKEGENRKPNDSAASSITLSTSVLDLSFSVGDAPTKPSPGRYRRGAGRTDSSTSIPTAASTPTQRSSATTPTQASPALPTLDTDLTGPARPGHNRTISADDSSLGRSGGGDAAKRYRRRSFNGLDGNAIAANMASMHVGSTTAESTTVSTASAEPTRPASSAGRQGSRPASSHSHDRQGSAGSASSKASSRSQTRTEAPAPRTYASVAGGATPKASEAARRHAPSPLSHPISPSEPPSPARPQGMPSAAVQHLTAVNDKDKGMKSRLRRAFSFGSAAELRRASAENNISAERAKLRKDRYQNEEDAEQAAIIAKQEAAGIGAGIYSGQGGMGSTDNLSVASAASSASIMLRKMGHGMKKGSRSIKGLFRPKSVIGVPAADGPITRPSVGEVSLVTVEAERQKVNVNADPHDQARGGTGYPRLERNSIDAGRSAEIVNPSIASDSLTRKSIVGSDRERAEVLSNIKKGILKRNGTGSDSGSPVLRPTDKAPSFRSNSPSTPNDKGSVRNEDYFARPRIPNGSTRSLPSTPQGSKGNITFSPRIQFHDAWSPQDYDRRGDIATCNRLTPMLAQQIKEELNSFKMEMEVHELSKPHTHFF
ncbi:hypothetical protein HBI56_047010 [Parastagonospora nodorum]|uniref:Protein BNI4 n=1 Tax=Phaeosphaeria nodorum (strain SN15 / ATCC MYA-4574 / FGSC 10173) TaxID=321614 RepID=A0A7U2HVH5_PHANO|nr:hypothetical protein HBH56_059920 [Parastagonospora nodorum]QRC91844.1 hypothetical protein JI435_020310 [Parastagonospora nodorum SN15]KAH3931083.1 hypothetical protein HBH54_103850 [Parastagonospora nodorum]KAH3954249.1 hypothetical protein HBH53_018530 [Parastagonospora nodorum]KAH3977213.1 hypothetical protein HBH52_112930 [Parastagonospora nodorum]